MKFKKHSFIHLRLPWGSFLDDNLAGGSTYSKSCSQAQILEDELQNY